MSGDAGGRARLFQAGKRVRIGVHLADGEAPFQEWAVVCVLRGDLLEVELSRDSLPQQVSLDAGGIVQVGVLDENTRLGCSGRIVAWMADGHLVLRLLDDPSPFEPREFFRQDLNLALEYRLPPSQFPQEIKEHWRQSRWAMEFAAQEPEPGEREELRLLREEIQARLEKRKAASPVAANVSGGGVRLNLGERLRPGMLVELGIYLPQPAKVLEVVGEVVQVTTSPDKDYFNTAFRYRFIDEGDRDRLIGYMASQQLWQLSQQAPKGGDEAAPVRPKPPLRPLRLALGVLIVTGFLGCEVHSILLSHQRGEKHEIARVFETGIMDFLRQRR